MPPIGLSRLRPRAAPTRSAATTATIIAITVVLTASEASDVARSSCRSPRLVDAPGELVDRSREVVDGRGELPVAEDVGALEVTPLDQPPLLDEQAVDLVASGAATRRSAWSKPAVASCANASSTRPPPAVTAAAEGARTSAGWPAKAT
jgi:hypothetical protein